MIYHTVFYWRRGLSLIVYFHVSGYRTANQSKYICISSFINVIDLSSLSIRFFEKKDRPSVIEALFICKNMGIRQKSPQKIDKSL